MNASTHMILRSLVNIIVFILAGTQSGWYVVVLGILFIVSMGTYELVVAGLISDAVVAVPLIPILGVYSVTIILLISCVLGVGIRGTLMFAQT